MKKLMTLTLLLLLLNNLYGQTIRDSVFNNVIPIDKTNVTTNGADFLIDIPIKPQKERIVIFSNDKRIPTNLFNLLGLKYYLVLFNQFSNASLCGLNQ